MRDVVAFAPVESAVGAGGEPDVLLGHVGQIGAATPIIMQALPGNREPAIARATRDSE